MFRRTTSGAEVFSQIGHCPHPHRFARCADYKARNTLIVSRRVPRSFKLFSAMQDQDQTSSRGMPRLSLIVTIREGFEKIAFRAEVVVFGHPPDSPLNPKQDLGGNSNFNFILAQDHVSVGNR